MPRKQFVTTSVDRWTRDMVLADEAIGAYPNLKPEEKERILTTIRSLADAGEAFYKTWQDLLTMLDDGSDGLSIPEFARKVLRMNALRMWTEPNPVIREKIFDALSQASVPKPKPVSTAKRATDSTTIAGRTVARPEW